MACFHGRLEVVRILLEYPHCKVRQKTRRGQNALHIACAERNFDIVQVLMEHKFDIGLKDSDGNTAAMLLCACPKRVRKEAQFLDIFHKMLLAETYDINIKNVNGDSVLHLMCHSNIEMKHFLDILIKNENLNLNLRNNRGETFLHILIKKLVRCPKHDTSKLLNSIAKTLPHLSAKCNVLDLFLRHLNDLPPFPTSKLAKLRLKDILPYISVKPSPKCLVCAIRQNSIDLCQVLLGVMKPRRESYINYVCPVSGSPLHGALQLESLAKVKLLLAYSPDMNLEWEGLTPLEYAVAYSLSNEIINLLSASMKKDDIKRCIDKCCAIGETPLTCSIRLGVSSWLQLFHATRRETDGTGSRASDIMEKMNIHARPSRHCHFGFRNWYRKRHNRRLTITPNTNKSEDKQSALIAVKTCRGLLQTNETKVIQTAVTKLLRRVSKIIAQGEGTAHLAFDVMLVGSMAEGTKCYFVDEIDFLCIFRDTSEFTFDHVNGDIYRVCVPSDHGFRSLCVNDRLEQGKLSNALYRQIQAALSVIIEEGDNYAPLHLFNYSLQIKDKISCLRLLCRGRVYKDMVIYVDLVPALELPASCNYSHANVLPLSVMCRQNYLIAKKSRLDYEYNDCDFHVSTCSVEQAVMAKLKPNVKSGFILAKAVRLAIICTYHNWSHMDCYIKESIRTEDYITSFMLKNILLKMFLDEAGQSANNDKGALGWAIAIYEKLEHCLVDKHIKEIARWNVETSGFLMTCRKCEFRDDNACCRKRRLILDMTRNILTWLRHNKNPLSGLNLN